MLLITEQTVLLAVIGSVGVLASLVVYLYGVNRTEKYERNLADKSDQTPKLWFDTYYD